MPIVRVEIDERRIAQEDVANRLIAAITDAVGSVLGADVAKYAEVIVVPRDPTLWAFGGRALSERAVSTNAG